MSAVGRKIFSAEEVGFFEGPEKLLEVWYTLDKTDPLSYPLGLRRIARKDWEKLLEVVKCQILSSCSNDDVDAYLLSESSLFVSSNRIILKTCGSTSLLFSVQPLMALVKKYFPNAQMQNLFYSHRSFLEPLLQPLPHQNFDSEVAFLEKTFEGATTAKFGIDEDTWYLYAYEQTKLGTYDQTVEVLMSDLNPEIMSLYSTSAYDSCEDLMKDTGLSNLMSGVTVDAKIFHPCGFSLNAISGDIYYTIHVTPQVGCSWVSFETNAKLDTVVTLVQSVLTIFQPGRAAVSVMANKAHSGVLKSFAHWKEKYKCYNYQTASTSGYKITYIQLQSRKDMNNKAINVL